MRYSTKIIFALTLLTAISFSLTANAQNKKRNKEKILSSIVEKADKLGIGEKIPGWSLIKAKTTGRKTLMGLSLGYGNLGITDFKDTKNFCGGDQWSIRLKVIFYRNKQFSIHTGIGYESNILKFKDVIPPTNIYTTALSDEKLVARYITIPIQFKHKLSKKFAIHAGLISGLNFNTSHTGEKFLWTDNGNNYTLRRDYKDFNKFKLDLQAGFTLLHITFYFKYGITDMFASNSDMSCHPMSWGISLGI